MESPKAFKHIFDADLVRRMSDAIVAVYPAFDRKSFARVAPDLHSLEMKPRVRLLRAALREHLPLAYSQALRILLRAAKGPQLEGFEVWPFSDFIQTYGLGHPAESLAALRELTSLFSSEFAVRPFLIQNPQTTLAFLHRCSRDPDVHVRRWTSEGTRPRLPWGERLPAFIDDPAPTLALLEELKFDDELYVRKSVANHLNDIAKDHPDVVVKVLRRWSREARADDQPKIRWIVHRALRTLIKQGHRDALRLLGVSPGARVRISSLSVRPKSIRVGDRIEMSFRVASLSSRPQKLVIDYVIHFVKANGKASPKVFKLRNLSLEPRQVLEFRKTHSLKVITTRVYYPGTHTLEILVNGTSAGRVKWQLLKHKA